MIGTILNGKYKVEGFLGEGGMGRVLLCTNIELGVKKAVKYIHAAKYSSLLNAEAEILKKINHVGLPKIVDVFEENDTLYVVEDYIEGVPLDKLFQKEGTFTEDQVVKWSIHICEALSYLHGLKPHPIIYRDLKPSNIIISHNDRAVIVDFGISMLVSDESTTDSFTAGTKKYAAPEQLVTGGRSDNRSDIYSLGVTMGFLLDGNLVSKELTSIIDKCTKPNPDDRYNLIDEVKNSLEYLADVKVKKAKLAFINHFILAGSAIFTIITCVSSYIGYSNVIKEKNSVVTLKNDTLAISEQQEAEIQIKKKYSDGSQVDLNTNKITWTSSDQGIATAKGGKILGINAGNAILTAKYGDKTMNINVHVSKKKDIGDIKVKLNYNTSYKVTNFAGTGEHGDKDGKLNEATFLGPISLASLSNGEIYLADGSLLRRIKNDEIKSFKGSFGPKLVRIDRQERIYFSRGAWKTAKEELKTGIFSLTSGKAQAIYETNAAMSQIIDFSFDTDGNLYILEISLDKELEATSSIMKVDIKSKEVETIRKVTGAMSSITLDNDNNIYMSCSDYGVIYLWDKDKKEFVFFAGKEKDKNFIDGINGRFFEPSKILAYENLLYVIDGNVIRKITIKDRVVSDIETVAGQVDKGTRNVKDGNGFDIMFVKPVDIAITMDGSILLADMKNEIIRRIGR